ncbi:MAG: hypothetical protein AAGA56_14625 [Myxococcota bacterium]
MKARESRGNRIDIAEAVIWILLAILTLVTMASTLAAAFPARGRALAGEMVVLGLAFSLAAGAWRRSGDKTPTRWHLLFVALRLAIAGPVLLLALVAAAAGFSA